jgi:ubiquinone/menaquinone biosynthesis C-methylase UbiE
MNRATVATYADLYAGQYMRENWEWRAAGIAPLIAGSRRILEVGAGRGQLMRKMRAAGVDWSACDPHPTTDGVDCAALPSLPYDDDAFDCSVTVDVLEHIAPADILPCLAELRRVAHRGAWAVANMSDIHQVNGVPTELHLIQRPAGWWIEQVRSIGGCATVHATDAPVRFWLEVAW